jgi:hypothetical protein
MMLENTGDGWAEFRVEKLGNLLAAADAILARLRSLQAMLPAEMDSFPGSPDTP